MDFQNILEKHGLSSTLLISTSDKQVWRIQNTSTSFMNFIRRWLITSVISMGIDLVEIVSNKSSHSSEFLASRLNLIPIQVDPSQFEKDSSLTFEVKAENYGPRRIPVTTRDLKWVKDREVSDEPRFDPDIVILFLHTGQKIDLRCQATLGKGQDHEKWSSVDAYHEPLSKDEFKFTIERTGQLSFEQIFDQLSQLEIPSFPEVQYI